MSQSSQSTSAAQPPPFDVRGTIGLLLVRFIVPVWIAAGALFKLWERNPKLLPEPVRNVSLWIAQRVGVKGDDLGAFFDHTLRFLIGTELALVLVMLLLPKFARLTAIFVLTMFVLVLVGVLIGGGDDCGCFGSGGPPPWAMLLIDCVLLLGVVFCKPSATPSRGSMAALGVTGAIASFGLAFLVPNPRIALPPAESQRPVEETRVSLPTSANTAGAAAEPWPAAPQPKTTYFPQTGEWVGRRLRDIDLAQVISRPLPPDIEAGGWHVVFYRGDCEHCHTLLEKHMASRAARTVAVKVPEELAGADLPMPDAPFKLHSLPSGPNYVFSTPILLAVVDGQVTAVCTDPDEQESLRKALEAVTAPPPAAAEATSSTSPSVPPPAAPAAAAPVEAAAASGAAWPSPPAPSTTYFPQFEEWRGKRLDAQPVALQMRVPKFDMNSLNTGRWHVIFYRADCEHCHALMETYLLGPLEERVIAIRVPDTDPAQDLPLPLEASGAGAKLGTLPPGPNYVFSTPILMTVSDGVIVGLALDSENDAEVTACLEATEAMEAKEAKEAK